MRFATLSPRASKIADAMLLGALALLVTYLLAHLISFQFGRDQGIYAVVGHGMLDGQMPYRDLWDFKPPGIYPVYALADLLGSGSMHAVRWVEALGLVALLGAFVVLSRRHTGSAGAGVLGGALAVLTHVQLEFWHTAQPEGFGAVALAWAIVCSTYRAGRGRRRTQFLVWAIAGALYTAAALLKPPLGGGFVVSLGLILWRRRREGLDLASRLQPVLAFVLGALAVLAATLGYFLAGGALPDLFETLFVFTPHYTGLSFESGKFSAYLFSAFEQSLFRYSAYNWLGLALLAALPPLDAREREGTIFVLGSVAPQILGVALQAKFFAYHFGGLLPLLGLLAGWGLWKLWVRARTRLVYVAAFVVVALVLHDARTATVHLREGFWERCGMRQEAWFDAGRRTSIEEQLYSLGDMNAQANRLTGEWIRANTPEEAGILVWGFEPNVYVIARRRPASRFFYNIPLRLPWSADRSRAVMLDELQRNPPAAVVLVRGDSMPDVFRDRRDSLQALGGFPALERLVRTGYRPVADVEDLTILLPAGAGTSPRP